MATKVKVKRQPKSKYPWVGIYENENQKTIVYFIKPKGGVCLYSTEDNPMHEIVNNWREENFKPCEVTIRST